MSFEVIITESVKRKIDDWKLSPYLIFRIEDRLYGELAFSPSKHLERLPKPADILQYSFCITETGETPQTYLFVFNVAYTVDETGIVIRDCEYLSG